nr:hypothetical protein [Tanacetum cinerariifolium]
PATAGKAAAVAVAPTVVAGVVGSGCCHGGHADAAMVRVAVYDCGLPRRCLPAADDEGGGFGRAVVVGSGVVMRLSRCLGGADCGWQWRLMLVVMGRWQWWWCRWLRLHGVEGGRSGDGEQFWGSPEKHPAAAGREWWPAAG